MRELFDLKNKVIIVTGATGVLGEAFVKAVAGMDAKVVLIGRNETVGSERANDLQQKNKEAIFIKADVLNKEDLIHVKDVTLEKFGRIDGLVNAAGGNVIRVNGAERQKIRVNVSDGDMVGVDAAIPNTRRLDRAN